MNVEPWVEDALRDVDPIEGFTREESREMAIAVYFGIDASDTWTRIFDGDDGQVRVRLFDLGVAFGALAHADPQRSPTSTSDPSPIPGHPDLKALLEESTPRTPDVRVVHAYTQIALLDSIRRLSEQATNAVDLHLLADAYLTLPSPSEDGFDGERGRDHE